MSSLPPEAAYWDERYAVDGRLWGDGPSELARLAVARLRPHASPELAVLDVGCGYGRDSRYMAAELHCRALGIDPSPRAVATAQKSRSAGLDVEFMTGDAAALAKAASEAVRAAGGAAVELSLITNRGVKVAQAQRLRRRGAGLRVKVTLTIAALVLAS